jgi:hypothetical protein
VKQPHRNSLGMRIRWHVGNFANHVERKISEIGEGRGWAFVRMFYRNRAHDHEKFLSIGTVLYARFHGLCSR